MFNSNDKPLAWGSTPPETDKGILCMHGEKLILASDVNNQHHGEYSFMEDPKIYEFGMDNCCTNHICNEKGLFEDLKDAPVDISILGIGGARRPEGIGTIKFQISYT